MPSSRRPSPLRLLRWPLIALLAWSLGLGTAGHLEAARPHKRHFKQGKEAAIRGEWDLALRAFQRAVDLKPDSFEYRRSRDQAKVQASYQHFELAKQFLFVGDLESAIVELQQTVALNPAHQYAYVELEKAMDDWRELQADREEAAGAFSRMKEEADRAVGSVPKLDPRSNIPIQFSLEEKPVKDVFRVIQDVSNINIIFDEGVRLDEKLSFITDNVSLEEALELLMLRTGNTYKVYNDHTIMVYPDNQTKRREYEDQVIRTFYLSNAEVKEVNALLRSVMDIRKTAVNESLNAITIRDTQDKIAIAGRIIEANDKAKAELVIDLEILEVNRSKMKTYGIDFTTGGTGGLTTTIGFDDTQVRLNNLRRLNQLGSWVMTPIPSVVINLVRNDADTRVLSRPQVRVTDGERVTVHLGDQVPIPNTTFNTSNTTGSNIVPVTSFTYQDVGIQIQLEPRIHHNREITLKMQAEISSVTSTNTAGQPTIGSREVESVIRLRDGEANLLAGLYQESGTHSESGIPGIHRIPLLRKILGRTDSNNTETEIILTVTPHIIRIPDIGATDLLPLHVGPERNPRLRGKSRTGEGGSPFGSPDQEPEVDLFDNLRPGRKAQDRNTLVNPDIDLAIDPSRANESGDGAGDGRGSAPPAASPNRDQSALPPPAGDAAGTSRSAANAPSRRGGRSSSAGGAGGASSPAPADPAPGFGPSASGPVDLEVVADAGSVAIGDTFQVAVTIDAGGHAVAHAPYHVRYDPMLVEVISVDQGDFFGGRNTIWIPNIQPGRVLVGHSLLGGPTDVPTGSGTLSVLRVRALAAGSARFSLDQVNIADRTNQELPVTTGSAVVGIGQ